MVKPLADRLRPTCFDEVAGQKHLVGPNGILRRLTERGRIPNLIFYGPPGTGKTTVAKIISKISGMQLFMLNATTASVQDVKDVLTNTDNMFSENGTLLYLDEIQSFNKKQQQSLLEFMEDGRITLIASTTENPYYYETQRLCGCLLIGFSTDQAFYESNFFHCVPSLINLLPCRRKYRGSLQPLQQCEELQVLQ